MRHVLCSLVCAVGCSKPGATGSGSAASSVTNIEPGSGATAGSASDPCSAEALGVAGANELARWTLPDGCSIKPARSPLLIADQAAFDVHITCAPGSKTFGQPLAVTTRSFSPAQVGLVALDDGKTITFVSVQRSPCPNDPRPMPGPDETFAYPITGDPTRAFAERTCTVKPACP